MTRTTLVAAAMFPLFLSCAFAQERCKVMDPTGTPLNVRAMPQGSIYNTLKNGTLVTIDEVARDRNGRLWASVSHYRTGMSIGWVYREFLACY